MGEERRGSRTRDVEVAAVKRRGWCLCAQAAVIFSFTTLLQAVCLMSKGPHGAAGATAAKGSSKSSRAMQGLRLQASGEGGERMHFDREKVCRISKKVEVSQPIHKKRSGGGLKETIIFWG